jgi:hypothetical protein
MARSNERKHVIVPTVGRKADAANFLGSPAKTITYRGDAYPSRKPLHRA